MNPICKLARKSIEQYLKFSETIQSPKPLPKIFKKKAGVFVSIHTKNNELKGCIGTFLPTKENLAEEIISNAISACSNDPRFMPIKKEELKDLEISVDVLSKPEPIKSPDELNPKKYGVIVKSKSGNIGLLLPDLEGVDTPEKQIAICCNKGGILSNEEIYLYRFTVRRYSE